MAQELFDIGDGIAVSSNPGGRFHGWLFRRHPDGQWVSVRKLELVENPYGGAGACSCGMHRLLENRVGWTCPIHGRVDVPAPAMPE